MVTTVLAIILCILEVGLIGVVLFQSGKSAGLSGAVAGAADTFMSKNKSKSMDARLAKATKWIAIAFVVLALVLNLVL